MDTLQLVLLPAAVQSTSMLVFELVATAIVAIAAGAIGGVILWRKFAEAKTLAAREEAQRLIEAAKREASEHIRQSEEDEREKRTEREHKFERDLQKRRVEIERIESRIKRREEQFDRREEQLVRREQSIGDKEKNLDKRLSEADSARKEAESLKGALVARCEEVSGMTADQAKKLLLDQLETELRQDQAALIRRVEAETKEMADKKARQIITLAIQKSASEQVSETTVSVVQLPNDEMKGRIIGREGRNIRTLEQLTGVNIIVDDTPEAVVISCFDPLRREVARLTLEQLVADGRIHPARVEEIVQKCERDLQESVRQAGESACEEVGVFDIHPELVKLLGRLKYRTSYGQNVLRHVIECAHLAGVMASELGVDAKIAKRAALLHDIGKAVSWEVEGTHTAVGAQLARKHREPPAVIHAIESHHGEVEPKTLIAVLVMAADAISASRPGARRETLESYIKRLEALEAIANSFDGVSKSYAIQAGREVRIVVEPDKVNDTDCVLLARNITKRIESELQYPGQIKIVVLRETRSVEYAR